MTSSEHPDRDLDGQNPDIDQDAPRDIDDQPTEVLPEPDDIDREEGAFDPDPAVAADAATRAAGMPAVAPPLDPLVEREYVDAEPAYVEREREVVAPVDDRVLVDDERHGNGPLIAVLLSLLLIGAVVAALLMQDDDNRDDDVDRNPPAATTPEDTEPAPQPVEPTDEPAPSETPDDGPATGGDTPTPPATPEPEPDPATGTGGEATGTGTGTSTDQPPAQPKQPTLAQISADPAAYKGQTYEGEATRRGTPVADNAFLTPEDVLVVAPAGTVIEGQPDNTYKISGTIGVVDDAFRQRMGEEFFAQRSYEQLKGLAVIELAQAPVAA